MVYQDRLVRIPVPAPIDLDPRLTADCAPAISLPLLGPLTVADLLGRLAGVEAALATCRTRMAEIRQVQPVLPPQSLQ